MHNIHSLHALIAIHRSLPHRCTNEFPSAPPLSHLTTSCPPNNLLFSRKKPNTNGTQRSP